jgi:hypothetical protein
MKAEVMEYTDILLGRMPPPLDRGVLTLMECAEAFHARAKEMEMVLLNAEAEGTVLKGTNPYRFRTGMLRSFIELCSKSIDLGSRRVTWEQMRAEGRG